MGITHPKKLISKPMTIANLGPYFATITPLISPVDIMRMENIPPSKPEVDNEMSKYSIKHYKDVERVSVYCLK